MTMRARLLPLLVAGALSACSHSPSRDTAQEPAATPPPLALGAAPQACARALLTSAPRLQLPFTETPRVKSAPGKAMDFAQVHTVNRPLEEAGVWADVAGQWSVLTLELSSAHARSLAVRLRDSRLPEHTEIWLCSQDGRQRQGPYRHAASGEIWTPPVSGDTARIEVLLPTAYKQQFGALLADAYGGYR